MRHDDQFPLEFGNLEEIRFQCTMETNYWVNVMVQNKKLRKIIAGVGLQRDHLVRIADELPSLEEFTMEYIRTVPETIGDIVEFLKRANHLKKAKFESFPDVWKNGCNKVVEQLEQLNNEWENTKNDKYSCWLVRKEF